MPRLESQILHGVSFMLSPIASHGRRTILEHEPIWNFIAEDEWGCMGMNNLDEDIIHPH